MHDTAPIPSDTTRRLFFALWPDGPTAQALLARAQQLQAVCGGRIMRLETLHLTLAFLGAVSTSQIPGLIRQLAAKRRTGGTLMLDRFGYFRRPRIAWAGPSTPTPWLCALHSQLWADIETLGLERPNEAFRPHVSLLRKVRKTTLPTWPTGHAIAWRANRLVLVASTPQATGAHYEVLGEQVLAEADGSGSGLSEASGTRPMNRLACKNPKSQP